MSITLQLGISHKTFLLNNERAFIPDGERAAINILTDILVNGDPEVNLTRLQDITAIYTARVADNENTPINSKQFICLLCNYIIANIDLL